MLRPNPINRSILFVLVHEEKASNGREHPMAYNTIFVV